MKFDYSKLRGRIKEKYGTQAIFAEKLGVSYTSLSAKLNNKTGFTIKEMIESCELLNIDKNEAPQYFFNQDVKKT